MPEKRPLAVILTALPVEAKAVRTIFRIKEGESDNVQGTHYDKGLFYTSGNREWRIAVAVTGRGRLSLQL